MTTIHHPVEKSITSPGKESELVLLFDGLCGFCDRTVQHVLKHDTKGVMMFAPLQSDFAKAVLERHPQFKSIDSMIVVEKQGDYETAYARSAAALRIAKYLGGYHNLLLVTRVVPAGIRDIFYKLFAKYRYTWFGRKDACPIPSPEHKARYIELP